MMWWKRMGKGY